MKRFTAILCIMLLALAAVLPAGAETAVYLLPESLAAVPASVSGVSLPSGLPDPVRITSFSAKGSNVSLKLNSKVPSLKITELDFGKAEENSIFSKKDTASAEAHRAGKDTGILTVLLSWDLDGLTYTREYNTWSGDLRFVNAGLTETADAAGFAPWTSAERELSFREDGSLLSEAWKLSDESGTFTRTALYGTDGQLERCTVAWRSAEYGGSLLEAGLAPDGTILSLQCRTDETDFIIKSVPVSAGQLQIWNLRDTCYDPEAFDASFRAAYPKLAAEYFSLDDEEPAEVPAPTRTPTPAAPLPATRTDLASGTRTDLAASETPVPAGDGTATERSRIWLAAYGDYFESTIYTFVSDDPLFILQDGRAVPNPDALDVYGLPAAWAELETSATPAFGVPAAE